MGKIKHSGTLKDSIIDIFYNSVTLRLMNFFLFALIIIDIILTIRGLSLGFEEKNLLLNYLFLNFGIEQMFIVKMFLAISIFFFFDFLLFAIDNYDLESSFRIFAFMMFNFLLVFQIVLYIIAIFTNIHILYMFRGLF